MKFYNFIILFLFKKSRAFGPIAVNAEFPHIFSDFVLFAHIISRCVKFLSRRNLISKKEGGSLCILSGELADTKTSAENLFSLPICDIMGLRKSLSLWERWRRSRRRGLDYEMKRPLTRYRGSSPKGRAFGCAHASLGVWALPDAFVIRMRNWR